MLISILLLGLLFGLISFVLPSCICQGACKLTIGRATSSDNRTTPRDSAALTVPGNEYRARNPVLKPRAKTREHIEITATVFDGETYLPTITIGAGTAFVDVILDTGAPIWYRSYIYKFLTGQHQSDQYLVTSFQTHSLVDRVVEALI